MIASLPAVQANCRGLRRYVGMSENCKRSEKQHANRRHRRSLNRKVRRIQADLEEWFAEDFAAPSLSDWELW